VLYISCVYTECDEGEWGENCANECNCAEGDVCNAESGCPSCADGWTGDDCLTDIDECDTGTASCDESAQCENVDGSYNCVCAPGSELIDDVCTGEL